MSEVRWPKSGKIRVEDALLVFSGSEKDHVRRVGVLLGPKVTSSLIGYWAISDRIIVSSKADRKTV